MFSEWKIGNESDTFKKLIDGLKQYYELLRDSCLNPISDFGKLEVEKIMDDYVSIPLVKDVLSPTSFDELKEKYSYLDAKICSSCDTKVGEWIESTYLYKDDNYTTQKCKIILCKECAQKLNNKLNNWLEFENCHNKLKRMIEDDTRHMAAMEQSRLWEKEFNESRERIGSEYSKIKDTYKGK